MNGGDEIFVADTESGTWSKKNGLLRHISVSNGKAAGVTGSGTIYCASDINNPDWKLVGGLLTMVSLSGDIMAGVNGGQEIYWSDFGKGNWTKVGGLLTYVSIAGVRAAGTNVNGEVFCANDIRKPDWVKIEGSAKTVELSGDRLVAIGKDNAVYLGTYMKGAWSRIGTDCQHASIHRDMVYAITLKEEIAVRMVGTVVSPIPVPVVSPTPVPVVGATRSMILQHDASGKCIDGNGDNVYTGPCGPDNKYQQWSALAGAENGWNLLQHTATGKCLDSDGNKLYFTPCAAGNQYQNWQMRPSANGKLIVHKQSGKCVDSNGDKVYFGPCDANNGYQRFYPGGKDAAVAAAAQTAQAAQAAQTAGAAAPPAQSLKGRWEDHMGKTADNHYRKFGLSAKRSDSDVKFQCKASCEADPKCQAMKAWNPASGMSECYHYDHIPELKTSPGGERDMVSFLRRGAATAPATAPVTPPAPPVAGFDMSRFKEGQPVRCPGGRGARVEGGKLRHYPSQEIATSWDPNWQKSIVQLSSCDGAPWGEVMSMKPATSAPVVSAPMVPVVATAIAKDKLSSAGPVVAAPVAVQAPAVAPVAPAGVAPAAAVSLGTGWTKLNGKCVRIDTDGRHAVAITASDDIYAASAGSGAWKQKSGKLVNASIDNGNIVGCNKAGDVYCSTQWGDWTQVPGSSVTVVSLSGGLMCALNGKDEIFTSPFGKGTWSKKGGLLKHVAIDGVRAVGCTGAGEIFCANDINDPKWVKIPGSATKTDISGDNLVVVGKGTGTVYLGTFMKGDWKEIGGSSMDVSVSGALVYAVSAAQGVYTYKLPAAVAALSATAVVPVPKIAATPAAVAALPSPVVVPVPKTAATQTGVAAAKPAEGQAVRCSVASPIKGGVFRYEGGKLRHYPNPPIAGSWDPNWSKAVAIDCTGIPPGPKMSMKGAATSSAAPAAAVAAAPARKRAASPKRAGRAASPKRPGRAASPKRAGAGRTNGQRKGNGRYCSCNVSVNSHGGKCTQCARPIATPEAAIARLRHKAAQINGIPGTIVPAASGSAALGLRLQTLAEQVSALSSDYNGCAGGASTPVGLDSAIAF